MKGKELRIILKLGLCKTNPKRKKKQRRNDESPRAAKSERWEETARMRSQVEKKKGKGKRALIEGTGSGPLENMGSGVRTPIVHAKML